MNNVLAVSPDQQAWEVSQLAALKQLGLEGASQGDLALFLHYAQRTGLDPFSRQIYMIGRNSKDGKKWTIQSSIDGLRIIAQRSGEYAGQTAPMWCGEDGQWTDVWLSAKPPVASKIGVYRKGFTEALWAVARLDSYAPKYNNELTGLWKTMPDVMLAKVAESLALRKAFPNDLSGLYTTEEMAQAEKVNPPVAPMLEATVVEEYSEEQRAKVVTSIAEAKNKAMLRNIYKICADHLTEEWVNPLGEIVTLQALIVSRSNEVPEE